jgi:uncharacterized radical SAM superfamily protein
MNKRKITLHFPLNTLPVSVTAGNCALKCKHCSGHYLKSMSTPDEALGACSSSFLVSGGCNGQGAVPLWEHIDLLKEMKKRGKRLNLHTGLIPFKYIPQVAMLADTISFDFTVDEKTVSEVYGLEAKPEDYVKTILELKKYTTVIPHITIGILGGKIAGETASVKMLSEIGFSRVVFIVFIPTKNTPYENCSPPSMEDVEKVFRESKDSMPGGSFGLGCMHPRGSYKIKLEKLAFDYGFDSFVNPSKSFMAFLDTVKDSLEIQRREECCVL